MTPLQFPNPPQRILIIKPSSIGDVVHALPVLNQVRKHWPAARISWLVTPACAGLIEGHPMIDEVILFERRRYGRVWRHPTHAAGFYRLTRHLRQSNFDLVIDLQGLFRSGYLAWRSGCPIRVGPSNARELGWIFYTHRVPTTWDPHAVERYLLIAEALGCGRQPVEFPFAIGDADRTAVAEMAPRQPYAVLLPGSVWPTKRWPVEHFAALVEPLRLRFGLTSVVSGGPGDAEMAAKIPASSLCGRTNLRQLVALLERAALVIANDSGPMHIAAALGRPLVVPFGPTNPVRTGPYGRMDSVIKLDIACSPCYSRRCSHRSCLRFLQAEAVLQKAEEQLQRHVALLPVS